ncbi:MAG: invasion associated locus B family protein [Alphaproteobacteria bacterium]|nr:invasion associated locus B family protein [Alphaproteobacteria bacterium]
MKILKILSLIACASVLLAPAVHVSAAEPKAGSGSQWHERCGKSYKEGAPKRGTCEIFQRLVMKDSGKRVVEAAIGFPKDKQTARGIFIVPLGVLLAPGIQIKIDDGEAYKFQARYCDNGGCYGYVDLNQELLDKMSKGNTVTVSFTATNQKPVSLKLQLKGFSKAIKGIS